MGVHLRWAPVVLSLGTSSPFLWAISYTLGNHFFLSLNVYVSETAKPTPRLGQGFTDPFMVRGLCWTSQHQLKLVWAHFGTSYASVLQIGSALTVPF